MTYDEAAAGLGRIVIYDPGYGGPREEGTLISVSYLWSDGKSDGLGKVRYSHNDASIKSTPLDRLTFLREV